MDEHTDWINQLIYLKQAESGKFLTFLNILTLVDFSTFMFEWYNNQDLESSAIVWTA